MKWIMVAIVACIVPYTWITLQYRKEGPAYEPYQDNKDRAQVLRLLDAGFRRVDLQLERLVAPADPLADAVDTEALPGGVPPLLRDVLIDQPPVPVGFTRVEASGRVLAGQPYPIAFTCTQPDFDERPAQSQLYLRGTQAVFIVGYDLLPGELQARDRQSAARLIIPAHTLAPGQYTAILVGAKESRRWTFEVL